MAAAKRPVRRAIRRAKSSSTLKSEQIGEGEQQGENASVAGEPSLLDIEEDEKRQADPPDLMKAGSRSSLK